MQEEVPSWVTRIEDRYAILHATGMPEAVIAQLMRAVGWDLTRDVSLSLVQKAADEYTALRASRLPPSVVDAIIVGWYADEERRGRFDKRLA